MPGISKLVLYPVSVEFKPLSWENIQQTLQKQQFIATALVSHPGHFLAGQRFLQWITFMGCSPAIEFAAPASGSLDFCHIQFSDLDSLALKFRCHSQGVMARCPECGRRIKNGQEIMEVYVSGEESNRFSCETCSHSGSPLQLGWRHRAGVARVFIDVYSVYPQEGIPTDQLLALLEKTTGVLWNYFYTDDLNPETIS